MKPIVGLRDIQGLDAISWWPLAFGWWVLIGVALLSLIGLATWSIYRIRRRKSWQYKVLGQLNEMDKNLSPQNSQMVSIELASLVRRIAMQKKSRVDCAGLQGAAWLEWLTHEDQRKANWSDFASCLIEAPFAPPGTQFPVAPIHHTIQAAKGWVA